VFVFIRQWKDPVAKLDNMNARSLESVSRFCKKVSVAISDPRDKMWAG
jgi:hypothetical protein